MRSRRFTKPVLRGGGGNIRLTLPFALLSGLLLSSAQAREPLPLLESGTAPRGPAADAPATPRTGTRADTLDFGFYDSGTGQAVLGETWTFDHGAADPLEGWTSLDTSVPYTPFRRITAASWDGHANEVGAPIPVGTGAAWCGRFEDEANADCWDGGLGYGNRWNARFISPPLTYTGSGIVPFSFRYFTDLERDFDYVLLRLVFPDGAERTVNYPGITDRNGDPASGGYPLFEGQLTHTTFDGYTSFRLVFELASDGGWSDEDGAYVTPYSGFGFDELSLSGSLVEGDQHYDFEEGDDGFTTTQSEPAGSDLGTAPFASYGLSAPCACNISGNVLEAHNDLTRHPTGQNEYLYSPPADRASLGDFYNYVFAEFDLWTPVQGTGTFVRPGWSYYPWICPSTGAVDWSPPLMQNTWFWYSESGCLRQRFGIETVEVPGSAEQYRLVFQVINDCEAFGLPENCNDVVEPGPLLDNLRIRVTRVVDAPAISFVPGCYFQDGFGRSLLNSTTNAGNADVSFDLHRDDPDPGLLGDSLAVVGPLPTASTQWEARMWWRIRREGPGQPSIPGYATWKTAVADGLSIVGPGGLFTFGRMDSMQVGTQVAKNRFISEFREDDDDFAGETLSTNEMIRDGMLAPGTQIEYFITSNFVGNPANYLLPDTTGRNYLEFEILPSYRPYEGTFKYPCTLLIDLNSGDQRYVEPALNQILNDAGAHDPIPNPTVWDRYDYNDATSNWNAPFARGLGLGAGGNNGITLPQALGYRQIIVSAGSLGAGAMEPWDFDLFGDWLADINFGGNESTNRQGIVLNGYNLPTRMVEIGASFLFNYAGVGAVCDSYREAGCGPSTPDDANCVRIDAANGAAFAPLLDYDAFGNACPLARSFDVLATGQGGVGNRVYRETEGVPPTTTPFAQVVKSVVSANSSNYRSVIDGSTYGALSSREAASECSDQFDRVLAACTAEIRAALEWIYGGSENLPRICLNGWGSPVDVDQTTPLVVTTAHLFPPTPNPFNPRTTLRFTLAAAGEAQIEIYDVAGRSVRRLVDGNRTAGLHQVVWDGTNDRGHSLPPGVYWAQLRAGGVTSNKRLVQLK